MSTAYGHTSARTIDEDEPADSTSLYIEAVIDEHTPDVCRIAHDRRILREASGLPHETSDTDDLCRCVVVQRPTLPRHKF